MNIIGEDSMYVPFPLLTLHKEGTGDRGSREGCAVIGVLDEAGWILNIPHLTPLRQLWHEWICVMCVSVSVCACACV